jgi:hypothetical protein
MSFRVKSIEVDTTVEIPNGGRRFASLASAEDGKVITVLIIAFRDAHLGLDLVDYLLQHVSLYCGNVLVDAKGATENTREVDSDAVIAGCGVVGEFQVL